MKTKIVNSGPVKEKIDADFVADALSAEPTDIIINANEGPAGLLALRNLLSAKLKSTGGRPRLAGTTRDRKKIPFYEHDWEKLENIAGNLKAKNGYSVTAAQLASVIIHEKLKTMD